MQVDAISKAQNNHGEPGVLYAMTTSQLKTDEPCSLCYDVAASGFILTVA
jgi:hypothetical protein